MPIIKLCRWLFCIVFIALNSQHVILDHFANASPPSDKPVHLFLLFVAFLYKAIVITLLTATIFDYRAKAAAFLLGFAVLGWVIFRHLPLVIADIGDPAELNSACMAVAIAGGAFIIADSFKKPFLLYQNKFHATITRFAGPIGKILFGLPMIVFGGQHILYTPGL
jgi:hypothetical protein